MAYNSYKLLHSQHSTSNEKMMYEKRKQVEFLYKTAMDRESNCTLNGKDFISTPRVFDIKISKSSPTSLTLETILKDDEFFPGDILFYDSSHWLCLSRYVFHKLYCKGIFVECNFHLFWQNFEGKIIDRWSLSQNASSYSNGESGNATLTLSSNQFLVQMPLDDDTRNLNGIRMFIDNVTNDKPSPYKLTRPDNVTKSFNGKGYTYYIFTLDQRNDERDKKVSLEDDTQVWICDYISPTTPPSPINPDKNPDKTTVHLDISSSKDYIKVGGFYTTFKGVVMDEDGKAIDDIGTFNIVADFASRLNTDDTTPNQIKIKALDDCSDLVGETFELVFSIGDVSVSKIITIEEM